jgi:hypothetical protein
MASGRGFLSLEWPRRPAPGICFYTLRIEAISVQSKDSYREESR